MDKGNPNFNFEALFYIYIGNTMNWNPAEYSFVQSPALKRRLAEVGWQKIAPVSETQINSLQMLFDETHKIGERGMFYSMYSKDLSYRKKVRDRILAILSPVLEAKFVDYKVAYAVFVIKTPGQSTEFFLHQDPSIVDEEKYSSLHCWIPLKSVALTDGPVCVIEKSHLVANPYRGISIPPFFEGSEAFLRQYLQPIEMEKGEALLLDPRLVHNSLANLGEENRIAVLIGIIPKKAKITVSYCEEGSRLDTVEQHEFPDDYFDVGQDFYMNCRCRPEQSERVIPKHWNLNPLSREEIQARFEEFGIVPQSSPIPEHQQAECSMFGEPNT